MAPPTDSRASSSSAGDQTAVAALGLRLARALRHSRLQLADNILEELLGSYPLEVVVHCAVMPLMDDLQRSDPPIAHVAATFLEGRLLWQGAGWDRLRGPPLVVACAPGERHTLGAVVFALAAAQRGHQITWLGAGASIGVIGAAGARVPSLTVLAVSDPALLSRHRLRLQLLARRTRLVLGGPGVLPDLVWEIGVDHLRGDAFAAAASLDGLTRTG